MMNLARDQLYSRCDPLGGNGDAEARTAVIVRAETNVSPRSVLATRTRRVFGLRALDVESGELLFQCVDGVPRHIQTLVELQRLQLLESRQ